MVNASDNVLLTDEEAAALLQPHMYKESITAWLANDRRNIPAIPFITLRGEPYYREADLVFFITHMLNPQARFVRLHAQLHIDHRNVSERRGNGERRGSDAIHLRQGIERRRWDDADRRFRGDFDRRVQSAA